MSKIKKGSVEIKHLAYLMYSSILRSSYSFCFLFAPRVNGNNTGHLRSLNVKWGENICVHNKMRHPYYLFIYLFYCTGSKASFIAD